MELGHPFANADGLTVMEPSAARRAPVEVAVDSGLALPQRAELLARLLRSAFEPLVAGSGGRPASLSRSLGVDRTLSARILRAIKAESAADALREIPAPEGLRILIAAAARAGVDAAARAYASEQVRQFERLINEFPGGRSALDAALGAWDPGVRQRSERAAKQAVHKAMSCLLGYSADAALCTIALFPSADPQAVDSLTILGKYGVRRLRLGAPVTMFGSRTVGTEDGAPEDSVLTTIRGEPPRDATSFLLPEFCTQPVPRVELLKSDRVTLCTLPPDTPGLNTPVSMVVGHIYRRGFQRYRSATRRTQWDSHVPRMPSRILLADVFLHRDVYPGCTPVVSTTLQGLAGAVGHPDDPAFQLDKVDLTTPVESLGWGFAQSGTRDVPRYVELLTSSFAAAGLDPADFRGFRCRTQYPVPLVAHTYWFDLPPSP